MSWPTTPPVGITVTGVAHHLCKCHTIVKGRRKPSPLSHLSQGPREAGCSARLTNNHMFHQPTPTPKRYPQEGSTTHMTLSSGPWEPDLGFPQEQYGLREGNHIFDTFIKVMALASITIIGFHHWSHPSLSWLSGPSKPPSALIPWPWRRLDSAGLTASINNHHNHPRAPRIADGPAPRVDALGFGNMENEQFPSVLFFWYKFLEIVKTLAFTILVTNSFINTYSIVPK